MLQKGMTQIDSSRLETINRATQMTDGSDRLVREECEQLGFSVEHHCLLDRRVQEKYDGLILQEDRLCEGGWSNLGEDDRLTAETDKRSSCTMI